MGGVSPIPGTCACPAIPAVCGRCRGAPAARALPLRAPIPLSYGRSPARTARWARSPRCWRRCRRGVPRSLAIRRTISSLPATATAPSRWCGSKQARVSAVACHPKNDILATGYSDGTILMVRINDGAEILVRRNGGAQVSALAWNAKGTVLGFAAEDGEAGFLEL